MHLFVDILSAADMSQLTHSADLNHGSGTANLQRGELRRQLGMNLHLLHKLLGVAHDAQLACRAHMLLSLRSNMTLAAIVTNSSLRLESMSDGVKRSNSVGNW